MGGGDGDEFFLFFNGNICCDPALKPPRRDGSDDGSQHVLKGCCGRLSLGCPFHPFLFWPP